MTRSSAIKYLKRPDPDLLAPRSFVAVDMATQPERVSVELINQWRGL
jgi:hypothetical protein